MAKPTFVPKIGERFGIYTVISEEIKVQCKSRCFHVRCDCGHETFRSSAHLRSVTARYCNECKYRERYQGIGELSGRYLARIKGGCRRRSRTLEFNLTVEYLAHLWKLQQSKCALTNLPIYLDRKLKDQTASLDRIDSAIGYVEGNVQWVHKSINLMKGELGKEEFLNWCKLVAKNG